MLSLKSSSIRARPSASGLCVGSFTLTTDSVIQKPNGKGRHEETVVIAISHSQDGIMDRRLVRWVEDGKDVTEKRRKKLDELFAEDKEAEGEDDDLVDPFGDSAGKYVYGKVRNDGDAVLLSFEPKPAHLDEEGMAHGTVSWHRETLDPLWIEMTALTAPSPLKELSIRMEFARHGETMYMTRLFTTGLAKILLFSRQFEVNVRISKVELAPHAMD